jgi:metal-responsive CopG/Arc/MetJ family transcriptional regulator
MNRTNTFPVTMTLRLTNKMADDLDDIVSTVRLSRSKFIRHCIQAAINVARKADCAEEAL